MLRYCLAICSVLVSLLAAPAGARTNAPPPPLRIGLTPVFLDDQSRFLNVWREYLAHRLKRDVVFVQRGSYRETIDLVRSDKLDFAWVCGYPYVRHRAEMKLLAVPLYRGKPLYQSYLIVPATDTGTRSLLDLQGKVFAYSDPDSNSGYLYPRYALFRAHKNPDAFFRKTFFTWAHRKVIEAVAAGLANGGAVDGYIWETLRLYNPELTGRTRVIAKSPEFGHTPFVARASISAGDFAAMQRVLLQMRLDPEGAQLLRQLNLDGFVPGDDRLYEGIAQMARAVRETTHAALP